MGIQARPTLYALHDTINDTFKSVTSLRCIKCAYMYVDGGGAGVRDSVRRRDKASQRLSHCPDFEGGGGEEEG